MNLAPVGKALSRVMLAGIVSVFAGSVAVAGPGPAQTTVGVGTFVTPTAAASYYSGLGSAATSATPDLYPAGTYPKEIVELARALNNNPDQMFEFVRNNIEINWSYGLQKGALGALVDRSGTAFDQAMLLVQLIRQIPGYTATYKYGTISLTPAQFTAWSGITDPSAACELLANGGIPGVVNGTTTATCDYSPTTLTSNVVLSHVWVQVTGPSGTWVWDPSYKPHSYATKPNLKSIAGFSQYQASSKSTVGESKGGDGTSTPLWESNLNNTALTSYNMEGYGAALQTWLDANAASYSLEDMLGVGRITAATTSEMAHNTSLSYATESGSWSGDIPDAWRTTLRVQVTRNTTGSASRTALSVFDRLLFVDQIYGKKLEIWSRNNGTGGSGADTLRLLDETGASTIVQSGPTNADEPGYNAAQITLTANHPYAAASGTFMDDTVVKQAMMWMPLVVVNSWGEVNKGFIDKWGARDDSDAPIVNPAGCDTCDVYGQSAGDGRREQLAAAWSAQSSRAGRIHAGLGNGRYTHHHSIGIVTADTEPGPTITQNPDGSGGHWYPINDSYDRIDVDAAFSYSRLWTAYDAGQSYYIDVYDRRAGILAIAATLDALEGSVSAQIADMPDTASTATRIEWGNAPPGGVDGDAVGGSVSRKLYYFKTPALYAAATNFAKFEGQASLTGLSPSPSHSRTAVVLGSGEGGSWQSALTTTINTYLTAGFEVTASEESFLGPGQRGGAFTKQSPGVYGHLYTHQRGGALVAIKNDANGDPAFIAHVVTGTAYNAKGGGGGAQAGHQNQYDPSKAADVLKARFVDRSSAMGVDLLSGGVTYTSPAEVSVGQGEFPYKLGAQIMWRGGEVKSPNFGPGVHTAPQTPWTTNWHNALNLSSSGMEAMGITDARTAAGTLSAFMTMQDVYRENPYPGREGTALLAAAWWVKQISGNVATVSVGADTRQFVRRMRYTNGTTSWITPGPGIAETLVQSGSRAVALNNCGKSVYVSTRGWDDSGLSFAVQKANGDVQNFGYWTQRINNGDYCSDFHGFRLNTWTFPQGVTVSLAYTSPGASGDLPALSSVSNSLGRSITFTNGGIPTPGRTGGFSAGTRTISMTWDGLATSTQTDSDSSDSTWPTLTTKFAITVGGGGDSLLGGRYQLTDVWTADDAYNAATHYDYDSLYRVKQAKDRLGVLGSRPGYQFHIADGLRGDRVDPLGGVYAVYYDLDKHPIRFIDELNQSTTAVYDRIGRILNYTYPEGDKEAFEYDSHNNTTKYTKSAKPGSAEAGTSLVVQATWDQTFNKPATITDARGHTSSFTYFASGNGKGLMQQAVRPPAASGGTAPTYGFTYNAAGQLLTSTDPTSLVVSNTYDASGYLATTTTDPTGLNATTTYTTSTLGDVLSADGPLTGTADTLRYAYDGRRRKLQETQPDPGVGTSAGKPYSVKTAYDAMGRVANSQEGYVSGTSFVSLKTTSYLYDAVGNRVQETLPLVGGAPSGVKSIWYDALNRTVCTAIRMNPATFTVSQPDGCSQGPQVGDDFDRITKTIYDAAGHVTKVWAGLGSPDEEVLSQFAWSPNGQRISVTDGNGNLTGYAYDGFDRLVKVSFPSVTRGAGTTNSADYESYVLDANGNRTSLRKRSGATITYDYDWLDRVTRKYGAATSVDYSYDLASRMLSASFTSGGPGVSYTYDSAKRLSSETTSGRAVSFQYDKASNRTQVLWPDAWHADYTYDAASRLRNVEENGATSGLGLLAVMDYGNLNLRATLTRGNGTASTYGYDGASRLSSLNTGAASGHPASIQALTYNPASQLLHVDQSTQASIWQGHPTTTTDKVHDGLNRDSAIASVGGPCGASGAGFDCNGNLTYDGTRTFTYDVENRLLSETGGSAALTLSYDATGRLFQTVSGGTTTQFLYDGDRLIGEYNGSASTPTHRYVHGAGTDEPLVWYDSGTRKWLHADRQGSIVAWSGDSGATTNNTFTYGPYGEPSSWAPSRFRYTGQIALPEAGLYYYKARVYDPAMGRFLQTDPIGQKDDPNLYAYVKGDPENSEDSTGLLEDFDRQTGSRVGGRASPVSSEAGPAFQSSRPGFQGVPPAPAPVSTAPAAAPIAGPIITGPIAPAVAAAAGTVAVGCVLLCPNSTASKIDDEGTQVGYHYTNAASAEAIRKSGTIRANERGFVYFTSRPLTPQEANNSLFLGERPDGASNVVKFVYSKSLPHEVDPSTIAAGGMRAFGSLRNGRNVRIYYVGPNTH